MNYNITCPLCSNEVNELVSDKLRYESPRKVYRCASCGLIFLHPRMSADEERIFYEKEYGEIYSDEKGTTPEKLFESRQPDANLYYDWTREFLDHSHACLELGCASGYFLAGIRENVKDVSGIESHLLLKAHCKKIGIRIFASLEECDDEQFDRIFMFFLLEHIGDPINYLKSVRRVLKKEGKLFIVIPNVDDALLSLYDIPAFRSYYFTPAHQFYYSQSTLVKVLERSGLDTVTIYPKQRYDLSNHMHWMMYGKPGGMGKYNHVFSKTLLDEYAKSLTDCFRCDTLLAVVTKKND